MAENKKSFIAYSDWKGTFDALDNEHAGLLIKHIFAYVNDENPLSDNMLINAVFSNIKNALKRDLDKWETQQNQRIEAGKKSAKIRKRNATLVNARSVSSTVSDSVSVSVSDNVIKKDKKQTEVFNFRKELILLGGEKDLVLDWLKIRKTKKAVNTKTAFNGFKNQLDKSGLEINIVLTKCVESSWSGFKSEWLKDLKTNKANPSKRKIVF